MNVNYILKSLISLANGRLRVKRGSPFLILFLLHFIDDFAIFRLNNERKSPCIV